MAIAIAILLPVLHLPGFGFDLHILYVDKSVKLGGFDPHASKQKCASELRGPSVVLCEQYPYTYDRSQHKCI